MSTKQFTKKFEAVTNAGVFRAEIQSSQSSSVVRVNIETETPNSDAMKVSFLIDNESKNVEQSFPKEQIEQSSSSTISPIEPIEQIEQKEETKPKEDVEQIEQSKQIKEKKDIKEKEDIKETTSIEQIKEIKEIEPIKPKSEFTIGSPIIVGFSDDKFTVYDLETGKEVESLSWGSRPFQFGISPNNLNIIECYPRSSIYSMKLADIIAKKSAYDISSKSKINDQFSQSVSSFAISPNRNNLLVAIGYNDGMIKLIKSDSVTQTRALQKKIMHLAFSADGNLLITETDKICIWNVETFALVKELNITPMSMLSGTIQLSADNKFLYYLDQQGSFVKHNIDNDTTCQLGDRSFKGLTTSFDHRMIVTFSDHEITVRNPSWLRDMHSRNKILNIYFAPNNDLIIHTEDEILRWNYVSNRKQVLIQQKFSMISVSNN